MKKTTLIILFHCIIGLLFQSCCDEPPRAIVGGFEFSIRSFDMENLQSVELDTLRSQFYVEQRYETEQVVFENMASFGLNTAYATSCLPSEIVNPIDESTIDFSFDVDFELANVSYPANTNLLADPTLNAVIRLDNYTELEGLVRITFNEFFVENAIFPTGDANVRLFSESNDGIVVENIRQVFIDF